MEWLQEVSNPHSFIECPGHAQHCAAYLKDNNELSLPEQLPGSVWEDIWSKKQQTAIRSLQVQQEKKTLIIPFHVRDNSNG